MTRLSKKKPYEGHEIAYQRMKKEGIKIWGEGRDVKVKSCRGEINDFLKNVLSQPWAPKDGRVIELGCGTGPILRRVCKRGFSGVGIDVSKTAIAMAKEQSKGLDIKFRQGDVCNLNTKSLGKFDLVIDGLCLHCITDAKDRKAYLNNVFKILKDGGLYVLLAMCGPMDKKRFYEVCKGHKIVKKVIYVPFEDKSYGRLAKFNGKSYLPTRYVGHWREILSEIRKAGFVLNLIRYNANNSKDFCGTLTVGALK
jgi:SAM-dependent methyltransferase